MFDFWRNRGSTAEEKRLAALGAYLDNALPAGERERLEAQLTQDAELHTELEHMRVLRAQMQAMPRRRVPRSFALDPALYSCPKPQPLLQAYPFLRAATALSALLLIFTLALGAFRGQFIGGAAANSAAPQAMMVAAVEEAAPAAEMVQELAPDEAIEGAGTNAGARKSPSAEATEDPEFQGSEMLATPAGVSGTPATIEEPAMEVFAAEQAQLSSGAADEDIVAISGEGVLAVGSDAGGVAPSLLPAIQIGLGVVFLLFFILLLAAWRRSRLF